MVTITNGSQTVTVTNGMYTDVYAKQGWREVGKPTRAPKPEAPEAPDVTKKPVSEMNRKELTDAAKALGVPINGEDGKMRKSEDIRVDVLAAQK